MDQPELRLKATVVVVIYNMCREAPRTLASLAADYQSGVTADDYEVLVYENGSTEPLDKAYVASLPPNFRYTYIENASPSPVFAMNRGIAEARSTLIGAMIDGARIVTPGFIAKAIAASRTAPRPVVATMGWYLGSDQQHLALSYGYDTAAEDRLLESIEWPRQPYRLFEISVPDQSSTGGWFSDLGESNGLFMPRELWAELGGFEERFDMPGAGFANPDVFARACSLPGSSLIVLIDEATFHQAHGGIATNSRLDEAAGKLEAWGRAYLAIRGAPFTPAQNVKRTLYGELRPEMARAFAHALVFPSRHVGQPPGRGLMGLAPFNGELWVDQEGMNRVKSAKGMDLGAPAPIVALAHSMFRARRMAETSAICRRILAKYPACDEAARLLRMTLMAQAPGPKHAPKKRASYLTALAQMHLLFGDHEEAKRSALDALSADPDALGASSVVASASLPGPETHAVLRQVHKSLTPKLYFEIGAGNGTSLACVQPPTRALAIDPAARIDRPIAAEFHLVPATSDAFFASDRANALLHGKIDFAFIDGERTLNQLLRDFWNVERYCHPESVVAVRGRVPRPGESAALRNTQADAASLFLQVLAQLRPDLQIATVDTAPDGLTLIRRLDPGSPTLLAAVEKEVDRLAGDLTPNPEEPPPAIALVGNSAVEVHRHLRARMAVPPPTAPPAFPAVPVLARVKMTRDALPQYEIGRHSYGVPAVRFPNKRARLRIGAFCSIAGGVEIFLGGNHRPDWITTYPFNVVWREGVGITGHPATKGDVVIGNDVWIGYGVTIFSGVTIGDGAVIGGKSVVTRDVAPYALVAGNPAREVRKRFDDDTIRRLLDIAWWNWPDQEIAKHLPTLLSSRTDTFVETVLQMQPKAK